MISDRAGRINQAIKFIRNFDRLEWDEAVHKVSRHLDVRPETALSYLLAALEPKNPGEQPALTKVGERPTVGASTKWYIFATPTEDKTDAEPLQEES